MQQQLLDEQLQRLELEYTDDEIGDLEYADGEIEGPKDFSALEGIYIGRSELYIQSSRLYHLLLMGSYLAGSPPELFRGNGPTKAR